MTSKRSVDEEEIDNISINDEESSENVSATERLIGGGGPRRRSSDNADGDAGGRWRSTLRAFVEKIKKPGRYALGVSFILLVVAIWVSSSGLIQYVFSNTEGHSAFKKPFFITYASTSLFTIYLSGFLCLKWRLRGSHKGRHPKLILSSVAAGDGIIPNFHNNNNSGNDRSVGSGIVSKTARALQLNVMQDAVPEIVIDRSPPIARRGMLQRTSNGMNASSDSLSHSGVHHHHHHHHAVHAHNSINSISYASAASSNSNSSSTTATLLPSSSSSSSLSSTSGGTQLSSSLAASSSTVATAAAANDTINGISSGIPGNNSDSNNNNNNNNNNVNNSSTVDDDDVEPPPMTTFEVCRFALQFAPIWFIANVTFNWSLSMTSVSSSSVISSTSGLFTFLIGVLLGQAVFRWVKLLGIALSIGGVALIAINDRDPMQTERFDGDLLCLFSAVMYACYANFLQRIMIWPGFLVLDWLSLEQFEWPSPQVAGFLVLNGLIGTVLSDWLWVQSMLLTTPLISTLGLSLTIPAALLFDSFRGKSFTLLYFAGASLVLAGFVTTTVAEHRLKAKAAQVAHNNQSAALVNANSK